MFLSDKQLENYWNNKIFPCNEILYRARNNKDMNVLDFFNKNNCDVPIINAKNNDKKALACLNWVYLNINYVKELGENWQFANETIKRLMGDCEDGAILLGNLMRASGIPYWRIRINAGKVDGGNHAYITYLKESDNRWYVLDWCYWYNPKGTLWSEAKKYFGIWWSFNNKYGFKKPLLDRM